MNEAKINELFSDEAFVEKLFNMETAEQAQAALKEKGVELSADELSKIRETILAQANSEGELSLDALDDVAGGVVVKVLAARAVVNVARRILSRW